ncbi:MAG: hypothetical protein ACOYT8_05285 [Candidatus Dependentiae bacterium]
MNAQPNERKNITTDSSSPINSSGLYISARHASVIFAGALLFSFLIFMSGFFLGQKKAVDEFSQKVDQESLADQIYSSLCTLYDIKPEEESEEQESSSEQVVESEPVTDAKASSVEHISITNADKHLEEVKPIKHYYAKLAGFGTQKAAIAFQERLAKKDIIVEIKKIQSRSKKGRVITWYQAITPMFDDELVFLGVIERIKAYERIKDIVPIIIG